MFRALLLFNGNGSGNGSSEGNGEEKKAILPAPLSVTLIAKEPASHFPPVELALTREGVFTTAVGHSSKRTLAAWHVTSPEAVIELLLDLGRIAAHDVDEARSHL